MIMIKGFPLVYMVCFHMISFSLTCGVPLRDQIACLIEAFDLYQSNDVCTGSGTRPVENSTNVCNSVCLNTTPAIMTGKYPASRSQIELLVVIDNKTQLLNTTGKCALQITCKINTSDCCNKHTSDGESSVSQCITQLTTQGSKPSFVSNKVNETTGTILKTTNGIESDSSQVSGNTTPIQENPKNETQTQENGVRDCTSTTGIIVGAAFIGLFVGILTTGLIYFFQQKRRSQFFKRPAVSHPLYNLNGREASLKATSGETYNEIENDSLNPKISYVSPIIKDQPESSIATNNPEIYHHLREDYDVKDRSNYYDHAVPLHGSQEIESDHYGKLATEENGAYSTVKKTAITEQEIVRNEAYSTIETNEFQLMELDGNDKENAANYFVLAKE